MPRPNIKRVPTIGSETRLNSEMRRDDDTGPLRMTLRPHSHTPLQLLLWLNDCWVNHRSTNESWADSCRLDESWIHECWVNEFWINECRMNHIGLALRRVSLWKPCRGSIVPQSRQLPVC